MLEDVFADQIFFCVDEEKDYGFITLPEDPVILATISKRSFESMMCLSFIDS